MEAPLSRIEALVAGKTGLSDMKNLERKREALRLKIELCYTRELGITMLKLHPKITLLEKVRRYWGACESRDNFGEKNLNIVRISTLISRWTPASWTVGALALVETIARASTPQVRIAPFVLLAAFPWIRQMESDFGTLLLLDSSYSRLAYEGRRLIREVQPDSYLLKGKQYDTENEAQFEKDYQIRAFMNNRFLKQHGSSLEKARVQAYKDLEKTNIKPLQLHPLDVPDYTKQYANSLPNDFSMPDSTSLNPTDSYRTTRSTQNDKYEAEAVEVSEPTEAYEAVDKLEPVDQYIPVDAFHPVEEWEPLEQLETIEPLAQEVDSITVSENYVPEDRNTGTWDAESPINAERSAFERRRRRIENAMQRRAREQEKKQSKGSNDKN
uniref:Uncharacterized protein n=1 Tax=Amorphochlora amoebiformis TaxID=1561963 RepID=A0A7S0DM47_9EUKA